MKEKKRKKKVKSVRKVYMNSFIKKCFPLKYKY